jgi:putative transposase
MSTYADLTIPLEPDFYYHIYNRGNNSQKTFFIPDNYVYFLKKLNEYMSGYFFFYCYCLLPNHFHLLIRVKDKKTVFKSAHNDFSSLKDFNNKKPEYFVSERLRRFFLSYSKSLNKQQNRYGSLFQKNFRRRKINSEEYFRELVRYIHLNPISHNISDNFNNYPWSSYFRILQD